MYSTRLLEAVDFAAKKHVDQRRKNSQAAPYINHPIGVALLLQQAGVTDEDVVIAALLHDTVEDTDTSFSEILEHFGERVLKFVKGVTDDKSLPKDVRKKLQVEHVRNSCDEIKLIKMADKLYNLRDLTSDVPNGWEPKRVQGYMVWAKTCIEQCLGINKFLETELNRVFNSTFNIEDEIYDCIPKDVNLEEVLEEYYVSMQTAGD